MTHHLLAARSAVTTVQKPTSGGGLSPAVVMYLLMIALPILFTVGPVFMSGVRAVLLVTFIPLAIRLFSGKLGRILLTDVLLLAYLLWSVAMLFINSPSQAVSIGGAYILEVYGSYLLARNYIRTMEQFLAMCRGLFTVLIFSLPFAIYETQTGRALIPELIAKLPGVYSHPNYAATMGGRRLGLERSQVLFSHPIHYGLFCSTLFSLALVGFKERIGNFRRYLLGALVAAGVVASVSSGALLPVFLQVGLIAWAWGFRNVSSRWKIFTTIVVVCYVAVDLISNRTGVEVLLSYATLSPETAHGRIVIFRWGMLSVWTNPIFGNGLNDWERPWWLATSVDNFWLLVTMRYGIPGFILLASAYLFLVWKVMHRDFGASGPTWQIRRAWVFTQISLILSLCTVDIWTTALSYVFFLLGSAVWMLSAQDTAVSDEPENVLSGDQLAIRFTRFSAIRHRAPIGHSSSLGS